MPTSPTDYRMLRTKHGLEGNKGPFVPKRRKLNQDHEDEQEPSRTAPASALSHDDYTVGWICALPLEMAAAKAMLDNIHLDLPNSPIDYNTYTLGRMGVHNVVVACLP